MSFEYKIVAHPTTYSRVVFRSRLEARWAAFFDLLEWAWEYEPVDLAGWTPDFFVSCPHYLHAERGVYVEVKPYATLQEFESEKKLQAYPEKLLLGSDPTAAFLYRDHGDLYPYEEDAQIGNVGMYRLFAYDNPTGVWLPNHYTTFWKRAGNMTQWRPQ